MSAPRGKSSASWANNSHTHLHLAPGDGAGWRRGSARVLERQGEDSVCQDKGKIMDGKMEEQKRRRSVWREGRCGDGRCAWEGMMGDRML